MFATLELTDGGTRIAIFLGLLFPAAMLASRKSSYLVDYYVVVLCFNRLGRRLLDWMEGRFDERPILSLLPLIIGLLMAAVAFWEQHRLLERHRKASLLLALALVYAALVGAFNGLGMLFALLEYIAPFAILFYALTVRADPKTFDRWIRNTGLTAVVVAIYGWYQWAFMPPWDAAWIEWSRMWTSMGHPEPFKTSICSTMESRGPMAWFLATAAIPSLVSPRWRRGLGWAAPLIMLSAVLPSTVRSAWAIVAVGLVSFSMIRGGQSWQRIALAVAVATGGLAVILRYLPESEGIYRRLDTFRDIASDGSFQGRLAIAEKGTWAVLERPSGFGLGSTGLGTRLAGESAVTGDNGYLEVLVTFGLPGTVLLMVGFRWLIKDAFALRKTPVRDIAALGLAQLAAGAAALVFANWLNHGSASIATMMLGSALAAGYCGSERGQPVRTYPTEFQNTVYRW